MLTVVYIITYKKDNKSPQEETKRYTKEAAEAFVKVIEEIGGIAVYIEDIEPAPAEEPETPHHNTLDWN